MRYKKFLFQGLAKTFTEEEAYDIIVTILFLNNVYILNTLYKLLCIQVIELINKDILTIYKHKLPF